MRIFGSPNIEKIKARNDVKGLIKILDRKDENLRRRAVDALIEIKAVGRDTAEALAGLGGPWTKEQVFAVVRDRENLLDVAATGTANTAQLLIEAGADVDVKTSGGYTPLLIAAGRGKTDMVQRLLDAGADIYAKGESGLEAEFLARERGYAQTAELIREKRNENRNTP